MIELEQAVALMKSQLLPQRKAEQVPIIDSLGLVTNESVVASRPVPSFPRSGMDGYGVFAADTIGAREDKPVSLKVLGTLYAGDDPAAFSPKRGEAVRVMTGAGLPLDLDSVIQQEWTDRGQKEVFLYRQIPSGRNYGEIGEDIQANQVVFPPFHYLNSDSIGVLASMGHNTVSVLQPLRVGIIATGSELISPGASLPPGKIYNSTSYTLASYIKQSGSRLIFQEVCGDAPAELAALLEQYEGQVDLILTTGGVSVGEKDFLPEAVALMGGKELFHFVNMKPGTPVMGASWKGLPILALSGNPFATLVNFHLFYWPLLTNFLCNNHFSLKKYQVKISKGAMKKNGLRRFLRAHVSGNQVNLETGNHQSSVYHNVVHCNCVVEQPPGRSLQEDEWVTVYQWPQL